MDTILGFSFLPPLVLPGESPVLWGSLAPHSSCIGHSPASAISWSHRLDAGGICKSADILRAELTVRFPPCPQLGMGQLRVVRDPLSCPLGFLRGTGYLHQELPLPCFQSRQVCVNSRVQARLLTALLLVPLVFKPAKRTCPPSFRPQGWDAQYVFQLLPPQGSSPSPCNLPPLLCSL